MAALSVGMRLGSYEVTAPLGAGGMGEVYRARDPRLERDVALKVLPSEAFADPTARERLGREARSAAALSHPHICTVYEVGEDSGHVYIAMEFLEGETLAARLARSSGGLPAAEVTRYGAQIAAALAHAHARAIVHRDLKLTNVMLTRDGWVKVLDFGLARRVSGVDERTPTIAASLTGTRGIVGTPQYMAPEILLGSSADPRSDLWAMGVMLHELVSGELPFRGPSNFELSSAIVHDEPSPLPGRVPAGLRMVIARCLTKAPEQRYGSAAEVRAALEALSSGASSDPPMPAAEIPVVSPKSSAIRGFTQRWPRWVWMAGALAAAAVVGTAVLRGLPNPPAKIAPTQRQVTFTGDIMRPSLSPDGKSVAYIHWDHAGGHLMIQDLAAGSPLDILSGARILGVTGGSETEGGLRWSPDGSALMTVALIPPDSASSIYLVPRLGGRPRNLGAFGTTYAWSPDGKRVAIGRVSNSRVRFYNLETGDTSSIALSGPIVWVLGIDWSEARDRLLALTVGPAGQRDLSTFRPDGREQRTLASGPISSARWSCSGAAIYYLASHGQTAELFRIDIRRDGSAAGRPVQVYSGLRRASWLGSSRDGRSAVYLSADASWSRLQALVLPAAGKGRGSVVNRELTSGTSNDQGPALSPDGHWVAFTRLDDKGTNIYVMPFEGGAVRQLTFGAANCRAPAWSPNGRWCASRFRWTPDWGIVTPQKEGFHGRDQIEE